MILESFFVSNRKQVTCSDPSSLQHLEEKNCDSFTHLNCPKPSSHDNKCVCVSIPVEITTSKVFCIWLRSFCCSSDLKNNFSSCRCVFMHSKCTEKLTWQNSFELQKQIFSWVAEPPADLSEENQPHQVWLPCGPPIPPKKPQQTPATLRFVWTFPFFPTTQEKSLTSASRTSSVPSGRATMLLDIRIPQFIFDSSVFPVMGMPASLFAAKTDLERQEYCSGSVIVVWSLVALVLFFCQFPWRQKARKGNERHPPDAAFGRWATGTLTRLIGRYSLQTKVWMESSLCQKKTKEVQQIFPQTAPCEEE